MNKQDKDRLYKLMPATYRILDVAEGEPLRALLAVIESELQNIESDIEGLYDDWFIETCEEWVVPYIGDLLKIQGIRSLNPETFSQRAFVANTLAYRRGKGTAAVLEQLALNLTGWRARVVEFFQLLATTQNMNHVRSRNFRTPDIRNTNSLELLGGPFESAAHMADARSVADCRGKYNIPSIGLFMWRLQSYRVKRSTARSVNDTPDGRYTFNPFGRDAPLFNIPRPEPEIAHLAEESNVPGKLRRRALYDELEKNRLASSEKKNYIYFDEKEPVLQIFKNGEPVPLEQILICNLSEWRRPPSSKIAVDPELGRLAFPISETPDLVEVSYAYGFSDDVGGGPYNRNDSVKRWVNPLDNQVRKVTWQKGVTKDQKTLSDATDPGQLVDTLQKAVSAWNNYVVNNPSAFGLIVVMDSSTYKEGLTGANSIEIPPGSRLAIIAGSWPEEEDSSGQIKRMVGQLVPDIYHPHVLGDINVHGEVSESANPGQLILDGILIEGMLTVLPGNLGSLNVAHCTLVPDKGGLLVNPSKDKGAQNAQLHIFIDHSICGQIILPDNVPELQIEDSIVDSVQAEHAIAGNADEPGPPTTLIRTTVFGKVYVSQLTLASEVIFTEQVTVERFQEGCVRFSYVPEGSKTPRRYRCQSDMALKYLFGWDEVEGVTEEKLMELLKTYFSTRWSSSASTGRLMYDKFLYSGKSSSESTVSLKLNKDETRAILVLNDVRLDEFIVKHEKGKLNIYALKRVGSGCGCRIGSGLKPAFTSVKYGDPGYAQLGRNCAEEIRTGAEDGSEMGVFCNLKQPQREANFRSCLDEYLGFGLEAGIFYVT